LITNTDRPHMFIRELTLYVNYLKGELDHLATGVAMRTSQYYAEFKDNLLAGIEYYRNLAGKFSKEQGEQFLLELNRLADELKAMLQCTADGEESLTSLAAVGRTGE